MTAYRFFNIEYELFSLTRPIVDQKLLKSRDAVCFICLRRHRLQQKLWVHSTFGEVTQASIKWASRNTSHPSWMQILINSGQLCCTIPTAITDKPPMNQTFPCLGFQVYPMIHWFGCEKLELEKLTKIRLYKSFIFSPPDSPTRGSGSSSHIPSQFFVALLESTQKSQWSYNSVLFIYGWDAHLCRQWRELHSHR